MLKDPLRAYLTNTDVTSPMVIGVQGIHSSMYMEQMALSYISKVNCICIVEDAV